MTRERSSAVPLEKVASGGSLYVQIFVKEEDSVPREKVENLRCSTTPFVAWGGSSPFPKGRGGLLATELGAEEDMAYSLEELAAEDAAGMASKPDGAPLTEVAPIVGVGMLQPSAGFGPHYMPVERQEQVSSQNLVRSAVSVPRVTHPLSLM